MKLAIFRLCLIGMFWFSIERICNAQCFTCANAPVGTIFCDDFEDNIPLTQKYFEVNTNNGDFIRKAGVGRDQSYGMRVKWEKGEVSAGGLSKSFGKTPDSYIGNHAASPNQNFDEIYWRIDVRAQDGWQGGGPAKLSRAMCLANSNWAQGMMAHIWSGGKDDLFLGMDPASGIGIDGQLKSTKYNDFNNLRWLGFKSGNIDLFSTSNSDRWYCVVAHVKLNTPGLKDGIFEFWINDTLQASSINLDWHSNWNLNPQNLHINAIFFENYWNQGSPVEQERYFDNLVISTQAISCKCLISETTNSSIDSDIQLSQTSNLNSFIVELCEEKLPLDIELYDLRGQKIKRFTLTETKTLLNLNDLVKGVYFIKAFGLKPLKLIIGG